MMMMMMVMDDSTNWGEWWWWSGEGVWNGLSREIRRCFDQNEEWAVASLSASLPVGPWFWFNACI